MENADQRKKYTDQENKEEEQEDDETLKKRISSHPLYQQLVEAHLECLEVGGLEKINRNQRIDEKQPINKSSLGMFSQSDLDLFMEAYCLALGKLKEAIEEPQQESMDFIDNMHSQLKELTKTTHPTPAEPASTTRSSGD
ncbi:Homeobox protein knotted-1-like 1 [Quillaja saponaria]|uniref:Homeobox protein knotted-1-like 1 n=1 Tax=Quillaja saponaria TaxID=32244 RepID=A0AAD7M5Y5_QUISA|nr:Homeobox protein knotted-1-like 1 [Quillaja saponaria]